MVDRLHLLVEEGNEFCEYGVQFRSSCFRLSKIVSTIRHSELTFFVF